MTVVSLLVVFLCFQVDLTSAQNPEAISRQAAIEREVNKKTKEKSKGEDKKRDSLEGKTDPQQVPGPKEVEPKGDTQREPVDDPNYALLGEYSGVIDVNGEQQTLGLQVRPLGGGNFAALQYRGGLPGQKAYTGQATQLVGRRSGEFIVLSGSPWAIFAEHDHCLFVDRNGKQLGKLERIRRSSPTMGAKPPMGAMVLFDGTDTSRFTSAQMQDGLLKEGADVRPMFQDFNLHVEFRLPYMPDDDGQNRGNSGCYLQSRYEVQILDSFAQLPVFNGCSSIYRFKAPDLNMCFPPLGWQTYDIIFTAPRWSSDGSKIRNAKITVWHNGTKTQDDVAVTNKTGHGKEEKPSLLPIRFQNHNDPVRFRNIWIVDRGLNQIEFPVFEKTAAEQRM